MQDIQGVFAGSWWKYFGVLLLLSVGLTACEEEKWREYDSNQDEHGPDWRNDCGGKQTLHETVGAACGECGGGVWECVDQDQVRCRNENNCLGLGVQFVETKDVSTRSASFVGNWSSYDGHVVSGVGFCIAVGYLGSEQVRDGYCFESEMPDSSGKFVGAIQGDLVSGTAYSVVAYANHKTEGLDEEQVEYSEASAFSTLTEGPENLVATGQVDSVQLRWDPVPGSQGYEILRDGQSLATVWPPSVEFSDYSAEPGSLLKAPELAAENSDAAVVLRWTKPEEFEGKEYSYQVVAHNVGGQPGEKSDTAVARRSSGSMKSVELQVWEGLSYGVVETFEGGEAGEVFEWRNEEASAGRIEFHQDPMVGRGVHLAHVRAEVLPVRVVSGDARSYRLRAVDENGWEDYSDVVEGKRVPGTPSYSWQRCTSASCYYSALTGCEDKTICEDTTASEDGTEYDYRVVVRAPGAATITSNAVKGARAVLALRFRKKPVGVETQTPFEVQVEVVNQFGIAMWDIEVEMTLLREDDLGFAQALGVQRTDASGWANFAFQVDAPGDKYRLEAKFYPDQVVSSDLFDVQYGSLLLVSENEAGVVGDADSSRASVSGDGEYVVFESAAGNLVSGISNGKTQIYRKSFEDGSIVAVSTSATGEPGDGDSSRAVVSLDGRYVAFESAAENLVAGVSGTQIYRKDLEDGSIEVVSMNGAGMVGDGLSDWPVISLDGRYVAFQSTASELVAGVSGTQIYRKDLDNGTIVQVSTKKDGASGNDVSIEPSMSSDGRYVVFESEATNLVASTGSSQLYRKDLLTGDIAFVNIGESGMVSSARSSGAVISGDGRFVVFRSDASSLLDGVFGLGLIYRKDMVDGTVALVSVSEDAMIADNVSHTPMVSGDGRYVTFSSTATNLVPGLNGAFYRVFRKDMTSGAVNIVSANSTGVVAGSASEFSSISVDGRYVVFESTASNLRPGVVGSQVYRRRL